MTTKSLTAGHLVAWALGVSVLGATGCAQSPIDVTPSTQAAPRPLPAAPGVPPPSPASTVALRVKGRPTKGAATAPVTLLEFSDFECAFCAQYAADTWPRLDREYVQTEKVRYVFKHYPLEPIHPRAFQAHLASACAADQHRFWTMHDRLFASPAHLSLDRYLADATALDLDRDAFRACVEGKRHEAAVREDIAEAIAGGVTGAPVFVLALTDPTGDTITPARVIVGAQPFEVFEQALDTLLGQATASGRP